MTDLDDDELTYPSALDVASWRREVHALYAAVRAEPDPATAHGLWVDSRSRLFHEHPASPRREGQQLRHAVYVLGILGSLVAPWLGVLAYVAVAITWLVPDRRAERFIHDHALED